MIRLNITMPEDLAQYLERVSNKSSFIAQALREKLQRDKQGKLKRALVEGYQKAAREDAKLSTELDTTLNDGLE